MGNRDRAQNGQWARTGVPVVVYYCRTYVKAVRGRRVKRGDVCYGMLRAAAAACVDDSDSDHHALSPSRGAMMRQPLMLRSQSCRFRRSQTHFALKAIVERRAAVAKRIAVFGIP